MPLTTLRNEALAPVLLLERLPHNAPLRPSAMIFPRVEGRLPLQRLDEQF